MVHYAVISPEIYITVELGEKTYLIEELIFDSVKDGENSLEKAYLVPEEQPKGSGIVEIVKDTETLETLAKKIKEMPKPMLFR